MTNDDYMPANKFIEKFNKNYSGWYNLLTIKLKARVECPNKFRADELIELIKKYNIPVTSYSKKSRKVEIRGSDDSYGQFYIKLKKDSDDWANGDITLNMK